jgi:hypothetical protein
LLLAAAISATCGVVAVSIDSDRAFWVATASGVAAVAAAMVAAGARLWRFVPRRRRRDSVVLVVAAVTVVVVYPTPATAASPWSVALLVAVLGSVGAVGWPLARRIDRGAAERRVARRMSDSRSSSA